MDTPEVAIIIPVYNDAATLGACLRSIHAHTNYPRWRIIVVDDGSTDHTAKVLREFDALHVIRTPRLGVAPAVNAGIAAAGDADVVRLHADVVIETDDWLNRLVAAAAELPKAGVVGARLTYPDGRIEAEGRYFISGLGMHPQHRNRKAFTAETSPGKPQEVDSVPGALAYYRRAVLNAVGGFDGNYGHAWMEDDDLCIAARRQGWKVYVHAGVRGVHYAPFQPPTFDHPNGELQQLTGRLKEAAMHLQAEYWQAKWGWNPLYPDLGEIRRLHGQTEICWQIGEPLRFQPRGDLPSVDCCLVTWNTLPLLRRCLESLAATDYPADRLQVIVADNGSTDGTLAYLDALPETFPFPLKVLRLTVNTGAAVGVNFAIAAGAGELVARLDDDIVLPPNWLRPLVENFLRRPFTGCVGPKVVNDDAHASIQCGPYRHYPNIYGHDDEPDHGQADYLARTTHVRGCCNLYRRDVFARCGLLDLRYSPSQFDDPDHHIALLHAGYEILYDGRVRIVHKLNSGLGRTAAALSNQRANLNKLVGKWGKNVYEVLERSIDASREGRYLPDGGDTTAWLDQGPRSSSFPQRGLGANPERQRLLQTFYDQKEMYAERAETLAAVAELHALALLRLRDVAPRQALDLLLNALNIRPTHLDLYVALATVYSALGQPDSARLMARRGLHLEPGHPALGQLANELAQAPVPSERAETLTMAQRVNAIGETAVTFSGADSRRTQRSALRVLMVNTFEPRVSGGDMHQIKKTRQYLQRLGLEVDICCSPRPDPRGYDLVHLWNTWFPHQTLPQLKAIRAWRPEIPVVLSPIYWDMKEKAWADAAVPHLFTQARDLGQLNEALGRLANGTLVHHGRTRANAREPNYSGYELYQRQIFSLVDHLLPQSEAELANLKRTLGVELSATLVHNGAENEVFARATPDWFTQTYKLKDFVLCVGLVEPRKNQLMLLHALRDSGIPVVIVGRHYDQRYYQLCRRYAPRQTLFIEHLPHEKLASAFKAARIHCLPSWMECAAFANVEAALCGCSLSVSDRTSEKEYFGANAYYCDPANVGSIRQSVLTALQQHSADAAKRDRLVEQFRSRFTWEAAAEATLAGYEAALARRKPALAA